MSIGESTAIIPISDSEFNTLIKFVYDKYGIELSQKRRLIEGRLSSTLRERNFTNFGQYIKHIMQDKDEKEIRHFLNKITTNHSYFGRESAHFSFLLETALPELVKTRRNDLRIWSAGCSAGQEAYNIAMNMDHYFGVQKPKWDTTILATDISIDMLNKAKMAVYPADMLTGLSPSFKSKYFTRQADGSFKVKPEIQKEVVFRISNLMESFIYKKQFDIIFCRNVMIYFDAQTTMRLVEKFYDATAPGGYFFCGHSEAIDKSKTRFKFIKPAIYQKV